ncbi:MAG: hypothetical protein J1F40_09960 [Prevotellaceae bacterium]|nr:hypothetical protein [Prevotellaceae bacterium]
MNKILMVMFGTMLFTTSAYSEETLSEEGKEKNFQLSLVSPIGTNGVSSGQTTNKVSFNIVGGYSFANKIFEFSSVYNVNLNHTSGFQFAGVMNYTNESRKAAQFAGVTNISQSGKTPFQFAGVLNVADKVTGLQFAGVLNVADNVSGLQFTGLVNVAKDVRGVQFGIVNYSDTCSSGVPIGIFNIVRHGGKQEFEVGLSDALNTYTSFKLGVDRLYTIFSAGVNFLHSEPIYGVGMGFGTDILWKKTGWANQIEAVGYYVTEDGKFQTGTNVLAQVKFTFSKQIRTHFKVFAGPTLNITVSDHVNSETGVTGSSLKPYSIFHTNGNTAVNGWVGFMAGVRF